jgi:hypothetical protein
MWWFGSRLRSLGLQRPENEGSLEVGVAHFVSQKSPNLLLTRALWEVCSFAAGRFLLRPDFLLGMSNLSVSAGPSAALRIVVDEFGKFPAAQ